MKPNRTAQRKQADRLFSARVRSRGSCEAQGFEKVRCNGSLQCCHIIRRRYLNVRWNENNALAMCGAHHVFFTHNDLLWRQWIDQEFPDRWDALRDLALADHPKPDYPAILERLAATNGEGE